MANFTTTLRSICESEPNKREDVEGIFKAYELSDYLTPAQIETLSKTNWSKDKLAKKIVDHYYFREIGFETYGNFKYHAKALMEETMEEFLPLIYSRAIEYDPLVNVDYTETYRGSNTGSGSSNSTSKNTSEGSSTHSDTPNVGLDNLKQGKYASDMTYNKSESNILDNTTQKSSGTQDYTKNVKGNSGVSATAQKMVEQFRENVNAYDREIIEKLNVLFMGLYE